MPPEKRLGNIACMMAHMSTLATALGLRMESFARQQVVTEREDRTDTQDQHCILGGRVFGMTTSDGKNSSHDQNCTHRDGDIVCLLEPSGPGTTPTRDLRVRHLESDAVPLRRFSENGIVATAPGNPKPWPGRPRPPKTQSSAGTFLLRALCRACSMTGDCASQHSDRHTLHRLRRNFVVSLRDFLQVRQRAPEA